MQTKSPKILGASSLLPPAPVLRFHLLFLLQQKQSEIPVLHPCCSPPPFPRSTLPLSPLLFPWTSSIPPRPKAPFLAQISHNLPSYQPTLFSSLLPHIFSQLGPLELPSGGTLLRGLMLATEACPQGLVSPCGGEESGEEELSVLPRHTKVIVTGNNRTKSVLVGLHGVVKKAVGLGGWHWLVLTNGLEVKLQRNALSVLEAPTGQEEDENDSEEMFSGRSNVDDFSKSFKPRVRPQKTSGAPKASSKSQVPDTSSTGSKTGPKFTKVNLNKLETTALLRYWKRFNLVIAGPNPSKEQLVDAVERHFNSQQLDEFQVIASFVQAAKRLKTVYG